jgi:hypothetical protein
VTVDAAVRWQVAPGLSARPGRRCRPDVGPWRALATVQQRHSHGCCCHAAAAVWPTPRPNEGRFGPLPLDARRPVWRSGGPIVSAKVTLGMPKLTGVCFACPSVFAERSRRLSGAVCQAPREMGYLGFDRQRG